MADITTLEEAQAEIVRLNDELTERTNERDTLSQNKAELEAELEKSRTLNQRYFERLCAQDNTGKDGKGAGADTEPPSCVEFARTLKF